jgi:hypothetical protein
MRNRDRLTALEVQLVAQRQWFELRITDMEKWHLEERLLLRAATEGRLDEMTRRLAMLNELRNEVLSDRALFVTRDAFEIVSARVAACVSREYYDEQHRSLTDKVNINTTALLSFRSRSAAYTAAIGLAVTVITAILIVIQFAKP